MKQDTIEFKAGTVIELSFASVVAGKEGVLFGEYFPQVMPILADLGGVSLGSFSIRKSTSDLINPQMSALFQWPNLDAFYALHKDKRFLAIKDIRDDALCLLSNGHFFEVKEDTSLTFIEGQSYAMTVNTVSSDSLSPLNRLKFNKVKSAEGNYQLDTVSIGQWEPKDDALLSDASINIYQLERNFPA